MKKLVLAATAALFISSPAFAVVECIDQSYLTDQPEHSWVEGSNYCWVQDTLGDLAALQAFYAAQAEALELEGSLKDNNDAAVAAFEAAKVAAAVDGVFVNPVAVETDESDNSGLSKEEIIERLDLTDINDEEAGMDPTVRQRIIDGYRVSSDPWAASLDGDFRFFQGNLEGIVYISSDNRTIAAWNADGSTEVYSLF